MSKKVPRGCCNCLYSAISNPDNIKHCGRKAGYSKPVSDTEWHRTSCKNWEYDGISDGFDAEEEYTKWCEKIR